MTIGGWIMKKNLRRGIVFLLTVMMLIGMLPSVSLAADNELVLSKIGHDATDTIKITNPATRAVTLTVPYLYSDNGNTVNLNTGLIIEKADTISRVNTSFSSDADATIAPDQRANAANRSADDIVVEDGLNGNVRGFRTARLFARADESLLFSRDGREHERRIEREAALREHACELHYQDGSAPVVVGAGCVGVVRRAAVPAARRVEAALPLRAKIHRVVMAAHINAARRPARR
jgi:hypothetical protein